MIVAAVAGCSSVGPWQSEKPASAEINLSFTLENNLPYLTSATLDGRSGRFLFGSANAQSVVNSSFGTAGRHRLGLREGETIAVQAVQGDLGTVADAIIGGGAFQRTAITLDYHAGLFIVQKDGMHSELMEVHRFQGEPAVALVVDGRRVEAVVDTALPDTLVLPAGQGGERRGTSSVRLGGVDFTGVDVAYGNVSQPRVGNRLLSKFLMTIDYRGGHVGLWRDPRTPLD